MAADVAGDFAAARGVADVDRIPQVERFDERRQVVGVGVHVVAVPGLARTAMAAAVMGDAAVAAGGQKHHLVFPGVRAQRPAVAEDDGLSAAPVLVVELDVAGIFLTDSNVWHWKSSFLYCVDFGCRNFRALSFSVFFIVETISLPPLGNIPSTPEHP